MMKTFIAAGALACFTFGCATVPDQVVTCKYPEGPRTIKGPALVGQEYGIQMSAIPLDAVQFTDNRVAFAVAVQGLHAARTPADTVQVTARLVNCTDTPLAVKARTSFMKTTQAPTEPPSAWRTVFLRPRSTGTYTESSVGRSEVANYLIEIGPDL